MAMPFTQRKHCPEVAHHVSLTGLRETLPSGLLAVSQKSCDHIVGCVAAHGPIERNGNCLLHFLK